MAAGAPFFRRQKQARGLLPERKELILIVAVGGERFVIDEESLAGRAAGHRAEHGGNRFQDLVFAGRALKGRREKTHSTILSVAALTAKRKYPKLKAKKNKPWYGKCFEPASKTVCKIKEGVMETIARLKSAAKCSSASSHATKTSPTSAKKTAVKIRLTNQKPSINGKRKTGSHFSSFWVQASK